MVKLSKAQSKTIEEYWTDIKKLQRELKFREWELLENKNSDENTGGGKSNRISDTTAQKATLLLQDDKYNHFKKLTSAIETTYANADECIKKIVDMRYWNRYGVYEWEDIAEELDISRSKVLRMRNILIDETAERLGWL